MGESRGWVDGLDEGWGVGGSRGGEEEGVRSGGDTLRRPTP